MRFWLSFVVAGLLAAPLEAGQQENAPRQTPDFLLRPPIGSVGIRSSWSFARADSDWYDFVRRHLTLGRSDFDANGIAGDLGFSLTRRVSAVAGIDFHQSTTGSEYRDYVDNNRLPITQRTRLRQMHVTGSARIALLPPGRQVGQFVWIPRRITPYAGFGVGALRYDLEQEGDFVDFVDFSVFRSVFRAGGWSPSAHVLGGTTVRLNRRLFATLESRYVWASADLGRQWVGFEPLDLSGIRLGTGINVTF